MLTNLQLLTPTAPDHCALLDPASTDPSGTWADAQPSALNEPPRQWDGIPHPWKRHDAVLGGGLVADELAGVVTDESNWSQALRTLGLKQRCL